eukprot:Gregarina_sp_Pseudo_9__148@NODE_10_length_6589_cov_58_586107_g8_i0_p1_GENE_NODE_10_length_6589_cov_58_586107_g8_i0NODE_10_length_6589_cov_58_586107_g8_i0_p1_ORF_typecomplete_len714_score147_69IMCp/PF12314_8/7_9IMCp/PF12314_8/7_2e09IMCp/PF12314_8/0_75_NODE_10_length_6589_cov_58_586107_g8_i01372278
MTDKPLAGTHADSAVAPTKSEKRSAVKGPGAVKITLHSANNDVDEKAEVTVALHNPEDAVEKMLQTLAQRFPPESVMTIAPAKGVDSSGSSSGVPYGSATGSRFSSSSDMEMSSQRREAGRLMGVNNPELIHSSMQSGTYVALSPEIRHGMASLPAEYTNWILANDPSILPELLNLATRGGDSKAWATQVDLDADAVANIVNALRNDPAFYNWVSKLASAALSPASRSKAGAQKKRRTKNKHQSIPTPQDLHGKPVLGFGHNGMHVNEHMPMAHPGLGIQPPMAFPHAPGGDHSQMPVSLPMHPAPMGPGMAPNEYYASAYPMHPYPVMPGQVDVSQAGHMMPGYAGYGAHGYPPMYPQGSTLHQTHHHQPSMAHGQPHPERTSTSGEVQPSGGSMVHSHHQSVDGHRPHSGEQHQYHFDQAGPGETLEVLPDGTRVRYVETPVIEERIIEVPRKEVVEVEKRVPKQVVKEVEKIVEVPEIQYVERTVEVEKVEEVLRHVPRKEYIDVRVEKIKEVKVPQTKIVEKIVEVPNIIERPKTYMVEQKVSVPRYVNRETQTVVAQKLRPVVKEGKKQKVPAKKFEPVLYAVDVPIPKPVKCGFLPLGKVDEWHTTVEIPAPQYNSLLKTMNRNIEATAIEDLFVRTAGGMIPLLPVGELTEIVPPVPSAFAQAAARNHSPGPKHGRKSARQSGGHRKHRSVSPTKRSKHRSARRYD